MKHHDRSSGSPSMERWRIAAAALLVVASAAACGPQHIRPFTERHRAYRRGPYAASRERPAPGSIWSDVRGGLFEDSRARRVGDLVTIVIDELADARGDARTTHRRAQDRSLGGDMLGLGAAARRAYPDVDPSRLLSLTSGTDFQGGGDTARRQSLRASITVRVREEMPNGDLFVEGTKVILINSEEYHLYVSGVVRARDISADDTVLSSRIADAQVEFTGRGDISDQQERGWLAGVLDAVRPW